MEAMASGRLQSTLLPLRSFSGDDCKVLSALEQQSLVYERLLKLCQLQRWHIQENQTEQLLEVLRQRQEAMENISFLDETIAPARKRWESFLGGLDAVRRAMAQSLMAMERRLLEQITAADRSDSITLQQRKIPVGCRINQAAIVTRVNRAYATAAYSSRIGQ